MTATEQRALLSTTVIAASAKGLIERALERNVQLDARHIRVSTSNNTVMLLHGTVNSWREREEAESIAFRGARVTKVENSITIE